MTAIVKHERKAPHAVTWAGLLVPGLGHLGLFGLHWFERATGRRDTLDVDGQALFIGLGLLFLDVLFFGAVVSMKIGAVATATPMIGFLAVAMPLLVLVPALGARVAAQTQLGEAPSLQRAMAAPLLANGTQLILGLCGLAIGVLIFDFQEYGVTGAMVHWTSDVIAAAGPGTWVMIVLCSVVFLAGLAVLVRFMVEVFAIGLQLPTGAAALTLVVSEVLTIAVLAVMGVFLDLLPFSVPVLDTLHPSIAVYSWLLLGVLLWHTAFRLAIPRDLSEDEFNSNLQIFLRTFRRNRTGMIGLFGVAFLIGLTLLTPLLAPFDPNVIDVAPKNLAPGWDHWMGTDEYGRDLFSRVLYGGRISLSIGFIAVSIAASIGTTLGAVAGYFGAWIDRALMFAVDMLLSLPRLVLLLAIVGIFRPKGAWGIFLIVAILGLTGWMGVSRIVRSQVLSLKQQDFVQAAQALGMSSARVVFRHLIPNAFAPVIVYCSLAIGSTILAEAGLSFLGLGVPPPTSTWGTLVNDGRDPLRLAPWIATFPGLMIVAAVMSFNLLGDGLRDALDPKLRGH